MPPGGLLFPKLLLPDRFCIPPAPGIPFFLDKPLLKSHRFLLLPQPSLFLRQSPPTGRFFGMSSSSGLFFHALSSGRLGLLPSLCFLGTSLRDFLLLQAPPICFYSSFFELPLSTSLLLCMLLPCSLLFQQLSLPGRFGLPLSQSSSLLQLPSGCFDLVVGELPSGRRDFLVLPPQFGLLLPPRFLETLPLAPLAPLVELFDRVELRLEDLCEANLEMGFCLSPKHKERKRTFTLQILLGIIQN